MKGFGNDLGRIACVSKTRSRLRKTDETRTRLPAQRRRRNEDGATAIEYGLIAACISVAIIAVVQGVGTKLTSTFTSVKNALK